MAYVIPPHFSGCIQIALFLRAGFDKFDNSSHAFRQSLAVPLIAILLTLPAALAQAEFANLSVIQILIVLLYRTIISLVFFFGGVWTLAWAMNRQDTFFKFTTIINWINIPAVIVLTPYMMATSILGIDATDLEHLLLAMVLVIHAMVAFCARHALRVNWMIATGISIYMLACQFLAAIMLHG